MDVETCLWGELRHNSQLRPCLEFGREYFEGDAVTMVHSVFEHLMTRRVAIVFSRISNVEFTGPMGVETGNETSTASSSSDVADAGPCEAVPSVSDDTDMAEATTIEVSLWLLV